MATEINYFLILELPFDPPENDNAKILETINKKRAQWAVRVSNPLDGIIYSEYIAQLEKIKEVMLNPDSRKEEAEKAKKIKKDNEKKLYEKLSIYRDNYIKQGRPLELDDNLLKQLLKNFSKFGFTANEIKKAFSLNPVPPPVQIDSTCIISKTQANNLKQFMRNLGLSDKTLYDFLNKSPNVSNDELHEAAKKLYAKISSMGIQNSRSAVEKNLCGLCVEIFKNSDGKIRYDNYLNLTRWIAVNEELDEFAAGNRKNIEPKMKDSAIDIAVQQYQLKVSDASIYINNYCAYMGYVLIEDKIICGICNAENPVGTINCTKCGKPLVIQCPSCGSKNNNSAKSCAKCGFDLTKTEDAIKLLQQAKRKYTEKSLEEAQKLISEAKMLWPNHEEILSLEKSIRDKIIENKETIALIMGDLNSKRIYSAKTRIEQAKLNGFSIDESISSEVSRILKKVDTQLAQARSATPEEAFKIFVSLSKEISDSDELNGNLKKFPPKECESLIGTIHSNTIVLNWTPSSSVGDLEYFLLRKENTYPNNPNDGLKLYSGKSLEYTDNDVKENVVYCYSVFVSRIGIFSTATKIVEPLSIVEKIKNVRAIGGDSIITLSWDKSPNLKEIKIWKHRGLERPQYDSSYELISCQRLDGCIISNLKNGETYWFAISAGYIINGNSYFSEKVYLSSVPQKPAEPLKNFSVNFSNEIFQASWQKSEWDVILFYSNTEPEYIIGTIYTLDEILKKYKKIDFNLKTSTEADFKINFVGECYIIPGVINASNVILNKFAYISSVPDVKDISFDLNSAATEMYVNFTWPKKIDRTILVYRMDDYPTSFDDPLAKKIECNKKQYDSNAGIIISNPEEGNFYAKVYTYFESKGRRIYSFGIKALLSNEPQREVYYTLKYRQSGFLFFKKKYTLTIEIEVNGECIFPPFVIVSKFKSMPLKRDDGEVVCTVSENIKITNQHTITIDISPLNKDTRLKMFFLKNESYQVFKLACKSGSII